MSTDYFLTKRPSLTASDSFDASPLSPTGGPNATRSNGLSLKIGGVLSASYADSEIRDALTLLDLRGVKNTAATRRQLRLDIQKDVIESNGDIIREFGHVAEQLKRIGLTISTLNEGCDEMRRHIAAAHQETAPVLEEASDLMSRMDDVENKQQLLAAFNAHFMMSDDEIATLTSTAEPVNEHFFVALGRAKKTQVDCEILLGTENQRLGLEIMEQTSQNLNGAFQKLYRWIQREFKSLNFENPQINSSIRRALRVLAERPSLFQSCLDFFAEARENILSDAFYTALTGTLVSGEEDKSVKPIELIAHDPLRYVGDMLAWIHSAAVSEREALEVLFISDGDEIAKGIQAGRDSEPWNKYLEDEEATEFDGRKALNELVDRNVTGVARVLKQRIEQVIQSHEETIMAYKIANLLNFYRMTFLKLLDEESVLLETLASLEGSAMRQFRALMSDHVAGLQSDLQHVPTDLGPPDFLQDGLKQLTTIMKTFETSFTSAKKRGSEFEPILAVAFEPYMKFIEEMSRQLQTPDNSIYMINCLLSARAALLPYEFTKDCITKMEENVQQHSVDLVEYQFAFFVQSSGLHPLLEALDTLPEDGSGVDKIVSLNAFQPQALTDASQILDDFVPSALMDAMENLKQIQSSKLARDITEDAADRFCEDFEHVEEKILAADELLKSEGNDEEESERRGLRMLFPRTSGEIRVLLT